MKRKLFAATFVVGISLGIASPAFGAEQHPPKFNVKSTQCTGTANQPNCPGSH